MRVDDEPARRLSLTCRKMLLRCSRRMEGAGGMNQTFTSKRQSAFSRWIRTGRLPAVEAFDRVELKFNPWHDPADGRFTFAGSGHYRGAGGIASNRMLGLADRDHHREPRIATSPKPQGSDAGRSTNVDRSPESGTAGVRPKLPAASRRSDQPNPAAEFVGGVGEGLYGVAKGTAVAAHSVLTTNPVTTVRNVGRGIAGTIDAVLEAENTPARIQVSRAARAIANASPRELGRATGSVVGNVALAAAPGAALSKVTALRRLRGAVPRTTYDPPQISWVKENLGRDSPAKRYNDSATGARPGQAPTLMRTMPDGSKRPVKFDGIQGDYVIDRKWSIRDASRARAQLIRQSDVLSQHRLIGMWEVPSSAQKVKALKILKKMKVTNINVKVVKP
jgi:hypothetical protein